jgi:uncharacterized protein (DUF952 family)
MPIVLHLMPLAEWQGLGPADPVTNPSLTSDGFIHCTDDSSVMLQVANAFYASLPGEFVVVHIDVDRLTAACVWEAPAHIAGGGESFAPQFPHVYGPIDRAAVVGVQPVRRDAKGAFVGYDETRE